MRKQRRPRARPLALIHTGRAIRLRWSSALRRELAQAKGKLFKGSVRG